MSEEVKGPLLTEHYDVPEKDCLCEHCRTPAEAKPYRLVLFCPNCGKQHVDTGVWATRKHRSHLCVDDEEVTRHLAADGTVASESTRRVSGCGFKWRPANVFTVGVQRLGE